VRWKNRRLGWGALPVDHAESHSCAESRARHEIVVCGFDRTQKIRVYGESPPPHPALREETAQHQGRITSEDRGSSVKMVVPQ